MSGLNLCSKECLAFRLNNVKLMVCCWLYYLEICWLYFLLALRAVICWLYYLLALRAFHCKFGPEKYLFRRINL